jgi:hypothetical protein
MLKGTLLPFHLHIGKLLNFVVLKKYKHFSLILSLVELMIFFSFISLEFEGFSSLWAPVPGVNAPTKKYPALVIAQDYEWEDIVGTLVPWLKGCDALMESFPFRLAAKWKDKNRFCWRTYLWLVMSLYHKAVNISNWNGEIQVSFLWINKFRKRVHIILSVCPFYLVPLSLNIPITQQKIFHVYQ